MVRYFIFLGFRRHYPFHYKAKKLRTQESTRQVFLLNTTTRRWETCGDLNNIFVSGPVVFDDNIYVVTKANTGHHFLEYYSLETDTWQISTLLPDFEPAAVLGPLTVRGFR